MRPTEAAKIIGCDVSTIRRLIRSGKLKATKTKTEDNQHGYTYRVDKKSAIAYSKTFHGSRGVKRL